MVAADDPASAVNLEYLAISLAVRRREGAEPRFSLDPLGDRQARIDEEALMQVKRFEPAWLAGTSVGEVLFQADFYLKELSMGEYPQPVVGMRSCVDYCSEDGGDCQWSAREWFFVRKAEVQSSEDGRLVPCLSMGVEAREQVRGPHGLEDARLTRPDHPLARYAEDFTRHFDLIAERRSVIYHLRELARAAALAKFLGEAEVLVGASWFDAPFESGPPGPLEIPQLWNRRSEFKVQVRDGEVVNAAKGINGHIHGVYGGVDFGLDRFSLRSLAPGRRAPPLPERRMAPLGAYQTTTAWGGEARVPLEARKVRHPMAGLQRAAGAFGKPVRGVDLNLDSFPLDEVRSAAQEVKAGGWAHASLWGCSFWSGVDEASSALDEEDLALMRSVFNPNLSDRRGDGERFVPPDAGFSHAHLLRELTKQEELVRQRRVEQFMSPDFVLDRAGPLFPASWRPSCEISGQGPQSTTGPPLEPLEEEGAAAAAEEVLRSAAPVFDRATEDGLRLRIYRLGALEVRTSQEHGGPEIVGAILAAKAPSSDSAEVKEDWRMGQDERIVKVTEYVERAHRASSANVLELCRDQPASRRYYVVFKTAKGNQIVTERLPSGKITWEENPTGLAVRCSLARVLRAADCGALSGGTSVGELAARHSESGLATSGAQPASRRKLYARAAYAWAFGEAGPPRRAVAVLRPERAAPGGARERPVALARGTRGVGNAGAARPQHGPAQKNVFRGLFSD